MKKSFVFLLVIFFVFSMGVFAAPQTDPAVKKAQKYADKGMEALNSNALEKALDNFDKSLKAKPDFAPAFAGKAMLAARQGKNEEALDFFDQALKLQPDLEKAVSEYAKLLFRLSDQGQKIQYLEKLISIPNAEKVEKKLYATSLYFTGVSFNSRSNFKEAVSYFEKLVQVSEGDPSLEELQANGLFMAGMGLTRLEKYAESNDFLQKFTGKAGDKPQFAQFVLNASYLMAVNSYEILNGKAETIKNAPISAESKAKIDQLKQEKEKINKARRPNKQKLVEIDNKITQIENEDVQMKKDEIAQLAKATPLEDQLLKVAEKLPQAAEDLYVRLGNYQYLCQDLDKALATYKKLVEKFPASMDLTGYQAFISKVETEIEAAKK